MLQQQNKATETRKTKVQGEMQHQRIKTNATTKYYLLQQQNEATSTIERKRKSEMQHKKKNNTTKKYYFLQQQSKTTATKLTENPNQRRVP